jgi:thioredoxin reductase (NADPH)
MATTTTTKVIIIGAGCAGLTAAIYAARAELNPIIFAGNLEEKGGLLTKTSVVENYPGFPDGILGYDLITNMEKQAIKYGTVVIDSEITKIDLSQKPYTVTDDTGIIYKTHSIIIATGSKPNRLGLEDEDKYWSKGISSCAVCDGALYRNKKIVVVGGGDSSLEEALFLTKFSDVTLIHRRDSFRASKIMQKRVLEHPKVTIIYDTIIEKFEGTDKLKSIICKNIKTNEKTIIEVDGLFYGLGLKPNTKLFENIINMDQDNYIIPVKHHKYETMTSVEGVFVAGDAHDKEYRQAIVASAEGCMAAMDVNNYLVDLLATE